MDIFYNKIKEICAKNEKVAMFIDMDGTIVEYKVYKDGVLTTSTKGIFLNGEPIKVVINNLKRISEIPNIDLYILTLSKSNIIVEEKKQWLKKYVDFIDENNWIIINKEAGEYNKENRNFIKSIKIQEKLSDYSCAVFLDDDHKILKQTQDDLGDKCHVFHLSSAII